MRIKKASAVKITQAPVASSFSVEDVTAASEYRNEVEPTLELEEIEA